MLSAEEVNREGAHVEWLRLCMHDRALPDSRRMRVAGACLGIAMEHHHAIVLLVGSRLHSAAFALVRLAFEAYVRGMWLGICACDREVESFLACTEPPKIDCLLERLEATDAFKGKVLSAIKAKSWRSLCAYTHTGGLHVKRWNLGDAIEGQHPDDEIREVLEFAGLVGSLAVLGFAQLVDDVELSMSVLNQVERRLGVSANPALKPTPFQGAA